MKALRKHVPRSSLAGWTPAPDRPDPVAILTAQERDRLPEFLPLRHARMLASPFAFYRGGAAIMAADLAHAPVTGLAAQLCGDAHISNFGIFATPERNVVFDVNDFDETLQGPWEWDVARMCASVPLAGQARNFRRSISDDAVFAGASSYARWMRRYAKMSPLDVWYARCDVSAIEEDGDPHSEADWRRAMSQAASEDPEQHFASTQAFYHKIGAEEPVANNARDVLSGYADSLFPSLRVLYERYSLSQLAVKVVGVGSVGMRCMVALMTTPAGDALVLQLKEAQASVLEAYLPQSPFDNHGQRVVNGQRLMQAASDIFLGWDRFDGRDYYVRQLRDMKGGIDLATIDGGELVDYAQRCGWALARAHSRSGDGAGIAAYLGGGDVFAEAMVGFANAYSRQVERDYEAYEKSNPTVPPPAG